jgi:hypothetical protein
MSFVTRPDYTDRWHDRGVRISRRPPGAQDRQPAAGVRVLSADIHPAGGRIRGPADMSMVAPSVRHQRRRALGRAGEGGHRDPRRAAVGRQQCAGVRAWSKTGNRLKEPTASPRSVVRVAVHTGNLARASDFHLHVGGWRMGQIEVELAPARTLGIACMAALGGRVSFSNSASRSFHGRIPVKPSASPGQRGSRTDDCRARFAIEADAAQIDQVRDRFRCPLAAMSKPREGG